MTRNREQTTPISLESERRKAMMLVHSVETSVTKFKEKHLNKAEDRFSHETLDYVGFVVDKTESAKRPPKNCKEFSMLANKVRTSSALLFRSELQYMDHVLARQMMFDDVITTGKSSLEHALKDHVLKYCVSFAAEANGVDIRCVQEYENCINRWQKEIASSIQLLEEILQRLSEEHQTFVEYIKNYSEVLHYMTRALEVFPKLCTIIKDWVTMDESYPHRLTDEISCLEKDKHGLGQASRRQQMKAEDAKYKADRNFYQNKKLKVELDDALRDRKRCREQELVLKDHLEQVEEELQDKRKESDVVDHLIFNVQEIKSRGRYDRLGRMRRQLADDCERLENLEEFVKWKLVELKHGRLSIQKNIHAYQALCKNNDKHEDVMLHSVENETRGKRDLAHDFRSIKDRIDILRRIKEIKGHPNTVKNIHHKGYCLSLRQADVTDELSKAIKMAAPDIGKDWTSVYHKLPFRPPRNYTTRCSDIQLIDLSCPRHDFSFRETALKSLQRWTRLSNAASITSLVGVLKASRKSDTAHKLEALTH